MEDLQAEGLSVVGLQVEGHRQVYLLGMCGEPWDSLVEAQHLLECSHEEKREAILGPGAGWHSGTHGEVLHRHKLLMTVVAVVLLSL